MPKSPSKSKKVKILRITTIAEKCQRCKGTGTIYETFYHNQVKEIICPICGGNKYTENSSTTDITTEYKTTYKRFRRVLNRLRENNLTDW